MRHWTESDRLRVRSNIILFIKKLQAIYLMLYKRYKTATIRKYKARTLRTSLRHLFWLLMTDHRLNGSSSPVLTATPCSYRKGQNWTPYKMKTPERIGMKFGIVDYVLEICPQIKFGDDRSRGGFWVNM